MNGIVCAIRGGPDSGATIARAITLAQETEQPLYFLYIVNLDFMSRTSSTRVQVISQEMHEMGEFILLSARAEAEAQGITAQGVVRHGNVVQEIVAFCREITANYLVVGQPRFQDEESIFTQALLAQFVQQAEEQTGAKVVLAGGGAE
jgi:nucleotide-binding universal stress UspA family protein